MKKKRICPKKKEILTNNNGLSLFVKGLGKRVDWIASRIYTVYRFCTWYSLYLFTSKTNFIKTTVLLLDVYMFQKRFAKVDFVVNIYSFHVRRYIMLLQNPDTCLILVIFSDNFSFCRVVIYQLLLVTFLSH